MKVGLFGINMGGHADPETMVRIAVAAEEAGFESVWTGEHLVAASPQAPPSPVRPDTHFVDQIASLAFLAGHTNTLRLGTGIVILPQRSPAVLAKELASVDVLSGGRLDLGVGVGWQAAEYEAAGLEFTERGRALDESLAVCRALWTEDRASHDGPTLAFDGIHAQPKPVSGSGVPIWVSGTVNRRTARRLAAFGCGWIPWGDDRADVVGGIARMRDLLADLDLHPRPEGFEVQGTLPLVRDDGGTPDLDRTMAAVPGLLAAGVTDCRMAVPVPEGADAATEVLAEVVAAFREVAGREAAEVRR